jgi:hypothetical protein
MPAGVFDPNLLEFLTFGDLKNSYEDDLGDKKGESSLIILHHAGFWTMIGSLNHPRGLRCVVP